MLESFASRENWALRCYVMPENEVDTNAHRAAADRSAVSNSVFLLRVVLNLTIYSQSLRRTGPTSVCAMFN